MKYFLDTEFIEDGKTIDLISIGIVSEDGRKFYRQNTECNFRSASDWVWRNVFPHLRHFNMYGCRACAEKVISYNGGISKNVVTRCERGGVDYCPWATRREIASELLEFCNIEKYGKPEFWGYYSDYDWVALCQLFGTMVQLPKGFPMFCMDVKQLCVSLGDPTLPAQESAEHNSLEDAIWTQQAYFFLMNRPQPVSATVS